MRFGQGVRRIVAGAAGLALCVGAAACGSEAQSGENDAAGPADFYAGKTVTIIVPYNPGGGFDAFVQTLAPKLEEELDGARVRVDNRPGGGGLIGANEVFQAEPDGLTIGLINYPGAVFAAATGQEGVAFDNSEWTFLGRLGAINPLVYTGADSGYPTFQSIVDSREPVVFGIGGVGSDAYYATVVMSKVLGFPNEIIGGYPGSGEADGALLAGEVDASVNSIDAALQTIEGSQANPVVFLSTEPSSQLPDVPVIIEFGSTEQREKLKALASIYDLERVVVAPPGVDEARADYLAQAVYDAASASDYAEGLADAGYQANPLARAETVKLAKDASGAIDLLTPLLQQ